MAAERGERVAFLFLGELLLVPHLWPIAEALAHTAPELELDLWVSTSAHEALLGELMANAGLSTKTVRVRRAAGFRATLHHGFGANPPLPAKLPMLFRLAPQIARVPVAVCAEQTSLWLPALLPMRTRFVKASHGAGSLSARDDRRRRVAWAMLLPNELERAEYRARGIPEERLRVIGYPKASFVRHAPPAALNFGEPRPIVLYTPHWQRFRSSWWAWGRQIVEMLAAQSRFNVILAPHQRLVGQDPGVRAILESVGSLRHIHVDLDSFATVDGSYLRAADIYLGDTSSQVVEFLANPRPCVFLNPQRIDWQRSGTHGFWRCGEVVGELDGLAAALGRAASEHPRFRAVQQEFAAASLGDTSDAPAYRAADVILEALRR